VNQPIRVLIADDQRVVREGLAMVLGLLPAVEVVGSAADGHEAVALAADLLPDIVLMDLRMPRCDGVEATRLLRERVPETTVIILTTYADDLSVLDALQAGARGYLTKDAGGADIRHALERVLDNHAVIDPAVQHHVVDAIATLAPAPAGRSPRPLPAGLTPREAEVLSLIATGMSNREIAAHLVVSEGTVKSHVNHLLAKIDARDRAQAVSYAYQRGLAPPRGTGLTAAFLVTAGSVVVWMPLDVRGFRPVPARDWRDAQSAARTGVQPAAGTSLRARTHARRSAR
jgi:DNA-binding NarL/FixJ family response regulator